MGKKGGPSVSPRVWCGTTENFVPQWGVESPLAGCGCPLQAGTGHGRPGRALGRCSCVVTSLLHHTVEGPFADDRTSVFPPSCCCLRGACCGELCLRGGVPGRRSLLTLLRVTCHCWGLTQGCRRALSGGHPCDVAACGSPPVEAYRLCAGFRQCGSFVEVCVVGCVLSMGRGRVLVRGGCA
jgi:hypothetical protein